LRRTASRAFLAFALASLALAVAHAQERPRRVVIGGSGDILFHTRVVATSEANGGFDHLFAGLREIASADDIAFANLETPLSIGRVPMRGNPPILGAPPAAASALARAGIDVVSVANNHAWDQRDLGLADTISALSSARLASVGAAPDERVAPGPVIVERSGVRVAFVAWTDHIQGHPGTRRPAVRVAMWDRSAARRILEQARGQADIVVASMHWGLAYTHEDRGQQRAIAADLVRYGADLVLGHGPHVLQRVERVTSPRGEAVVAYSLGNLISNQGYLYRRGRRERAERPLREPATRDGAWLRVALEPSGGRVRVASVEAVPLWTHNNYWDEEQRRAQQPDIRVLPLGRIDDGELRSDRQRAIARALGSSVRLVP
jgi:hypothetical protein